MSIQLKEKINISVGTIVSLSKVDLADLCNITEQAISAGGGFGWLRVPTREILNEYWNDITDDKLNNLVVGRLNGVIAGTLQLSYEAPNIESRKSIAQIKRHFVAPWARGYGLAKSMIDFSEKKAKEENIKSIQLSVRETQDAAIQLFSGKDYKIWGENPYYAFINGSFVKGIYFFKNL
tara:strand:+ start:1247 stop:1783 length:537 start_codon:yes stop_codon:yes gene_type:complete